MDVEVGCYVWCRKVWLRLVCFLLSVLIHRPTATPQNESSTVTQQGSSTVTPQLCHLSVLLKSWVIFVYFYLDATTIIYYQYCCIAGFWLSVDFNLFVFSVLRLIILSVLKAKQIYRKKWIHKSKYRNYINPYYVQQTDS